MTLTAFLLVFASAFLHAAWNFMSKKTNPSGIYYAISSGTAALLWMFVLPLTGVSPYVLSWKFWLLYAASSFFEGLYAVSLAYAYRHCDISIAYPMGRALPVLMVAGVTFLLGIGKTPSLCAFAGMIVIFIGCVLLPLKSWQDFRWQTYCSKTTIFLLLIAVGTTGYTIIDSVALKMLREHFPPLQSAFFYLFMVETGLSLTVFAFTLPNKEERKALKQLLRIPYPYLTGIFSSSAYALILLSMKYVTNVSYIQAFRQMSLPMGVFAGIVFLKEKSTALKLSGVGLIVSGLILTVF